MHVAIVGAGALGCVYGARLAKGGRCDVTFVVRPARVSDTSAIVIERIDGDRSSVRLDAPKRADRVPADADVILLGVSVNDLDERLNEILAASAAPIVVLTPLLPKDRDRLVAAFGKRLLPAMPSVAGYRNDAGVVRYWLPRVATTLVEEPRPMIPAVDALVRALQEAGVPSRLQIGTAEINAATTVTFLPLAFALDIAGSADALLDDRALLKLALAAAKEGQELGHALGKPAPWAELLVKFVGPTMLKIGVGMASQRSPEAVHYVEMHFGSKMHEQNVVMADAIAALAREHRVENEALAELASRLRARGAQGGA